MVHLDPAGVIAAIAFVLLLWAAFWPVIGRRQPAHLPRTTGKSNGVLVPVTDPAATRRAVDLACRLEGAPEVILLHVAAVPLTLPLDAGLADRAGERREMLSLGRGIAEHAGRSARVRAVCDRDLAEAVLRVAAEERARVIVLGVPEARLPYSRDWSRAADTIRRKAACEVIVEAAHTQQGEPGAPRPGQPIRLGPAVS